MNKRHPRNRNLHLHYEPFWNGYPVLTQQGPVVVEYLEAIDDVLWAALNDHSRTLGLRFDVRLPRAGEFQVERFIPRIIASLRAQLEADQNRRARQGRRVRPCRLRFVWAREQDTSPNPHFHIFIFVNRDTYHRLGDFRTDDGGMAARIKKAIASALGIPVEYAAGLAHFPRDGVHVLDSNASDFHFRRAEAFRCASYLAKAETKPYGNRAKHFGHSHG